MPIIAAEVPALPDIVCLGAVSNVGPVKLSEKGRYHVLPVTLSGLKNTASRDATLYLLFRPEWFEPGFTPARLDQKDEAERVDFSIFRRQIAAKEGNAYLQVLAGEDFGSLSQTIDNLPERSAEAIADAISSVIHNKEVGYILRQEKEKQDDGTKSLTDRYQVARLFTPDRKSLEYWEKAAVNPKRKTPVRITWAA
jgi:hypothetical protein